MNRISLFLLMALGLIVVGCSSSPAETSSPQDEAALKSGKDAKPPADFKAPGSDGQAPAGAPTGAATTG